MSIGERIKELRRQKDMTQEQLAELLGITSAAVSGWECGRNAPDISQIPQLCQIFSVSADMLLNIDLSNQIHRIDEIIEQACKVTPKEAVNIYRLGLAEIPGSYELMFRLAEALDYSGEEESYDARLKESVILYERVREGTKDLYLKNKAEGSLCSIYIRQGKRDKALKIAENVPELMYSRREFDRMLAQGMDKIYSMHYDIHRNFLDLCDDIYFFCMQRVGDEPYFSHEQAITMLEKIPKLFEVFYENGDYLADGWIVSWSYARMAEHYADMEDRENTLRCAELAVEYSKQADQYPKGLKNGLYGISDVWGYPQLPKEKRHTSLLASPEFDYPTTTFCISTEGESHVEHLMRDFSHRKFDFVRDQLSKLI